MMQGSNFGLPYPIYPPYAGMNNMMGNMQPPTILNNDCSNSNDMSGIENRLDNLERRVSSIENFINKSNSINNNYNSSNYQML